MQVVSTCGSSARLPSRFARHLGHSISSHGMPPFKARSTVGEGAIGASSARMRSFQLSLDGLSASWVRASPLARRSSDCRASISALTTSHDGPPHRPNGAFSFFCGVVLASQTRDKARAGVVNECEY